MKNQKMTNDKKQADEREYDDFMNFLRGEVIRYANDPSIRLSHLEQKVTDLERKLRDHDRQLEELRKEFGLEGI